MACEQSNVLRLEYGALTHTMNSRNKQIKLTRPEVNWPLEREVRDTHLALRYIAVVYVYSFFF
jgi:hypothetical protein